ncbi:MAG: hypothetical protein HY898_09595 [Deltaproteobacteria bacterium]|nr:hypothetical protein [Deltaproteobacteria bacterium]
MKGGWAALVAVPAMCGASAVLGADQPPRVAFIDATLCERMPFSISGFRSLLAIELANDGFARVEMGGESAAPSGAGVTIGRLVVERCESGSAAVRLRVSQSMAGTPIEREVQLADVQPADRARVVAIAMAEAIRGLRPAAPAVLSAPAAVSSAALAAPRPAESREPARTVPVEKVDVPGQGIGLGATMDGRAWSASSPLVGASLLGYLPVGARGPWLTLQGGWQQASVHAGLGDVDLRLVSGGVGMMWGSGQGSLVLRAGPRLEIGYGRVQGRATAPGVREQSGGGTVMVGALVAELIGHAWGPLDGMVQWEVGWAQRSVAATVQGEPVAGFEGALVGIRIGVLGRVGSR